MTRLASGLCKSGRRVVLPVVIAVSAFACGPTTKPAIQTHTEGDVDSDERFGASPALGNPPAIDATAPAADFLVEVSELIQPAWSSFLEDCRLRLPPSNALNDSSLEADLEFTIDGAGKLLAVKIAKSSGNAEFDGVANEILSDLASLPSPPAEWVSEDNRVSVKWRFARDIRQAGSSGGAMRRVILPLGEALEQLLAAGEISRAATRLLDAGARTITAAQVEEVLERSLELALSEEDPQTKAAALRVIGGAEVGRLKEKVRAHLESTDTLVATAAASALGTVGDKTDIARLEVFAQGKRPASRELIAAAALSLVKLGRGPQVVMAAIRDLKSTESAGRLAALAVLSQLESSEAVAALAKILNGTAKTPREQRVAAALALGKQAPKSGSAVKALLTGTSSRDAAVRKSCLTAISAAAKAGMKSRLAYWKVLEFIRDKDERVRAAAIVAAATLDPPRFAKELPSVRAAGSKLVVLSIAGVLGELPGPVAMRRLLDLAQAPDLGMRTAAALGLAKRNDAKAKAALAKLLADDAPAVRMAALSGLKGEDRLKPLLEDESRDVKAAALGALTKALGKPETAKRAIALLAASGSDRGLQVLLAQAWLVP